MSLSGIFAIGLSGLNAFSAGLESVSDNIANSQTTGFKRTETDFSTLVSQEATDGGISGGGVAAVNRQLISEQGAITRTNTQTNLAISGDGLFVVSQSADANAANETFSFTRAGGFDARADGALVNEAGYFLQGFAIGENGAVPAAGSLNALETVNINRIESLSAATSALSLSGNLSANAAVGETVTRTFQVFDENGVPRNLVLTLTNSGPNLWAAQAAFADGAQETVAAGSLAFDANGRIDQTASSFPASFTTGGQSVALDLSGVTGLPRGASVLTASSDGAATGVLSGVEISRDGRVTALFSNGLRRDIFQVALASFINPDGLDDGPASTFLLNGAAGDLSIDIPGTGRAGAIESAALEISTVDIGQEFSTLIQTQRAYSANARILTVADELLQTLNLTAR